MKKFLEVIIFVGVILIISIVVDVGAVMKTANDKQAKAEEETEQTADFDCKTAILEYLSSSDEEFNEFIETTLASTGTTSDLITNYLVPKYTEFLELSEATLVSETIVSGSYEITDTSEKIVECQSIIDEHLEANTEIMKAEVASSASAKKSTVLSDEYKWINEHLREMAMSIAYIQSYLSKMDSALPGFTKTCVTK